MDQWKNIWEKSFKEKRYRKTLHFLFWLLYFSSFSFWNFYLFALFGFKGKDLWVSFIVTMLFNIVVVISTYYLIIKSYYPYLVDKHNYRKFYIFFFLNIFLYCVLLIITNKFCDWLLPLLGINIHLMNTLNDLRLNNGLMGVAQMAISYFALFCLPVAAKFFRDQLRQQQQSKNLMEQNLQLQMDFLKAQIHPHFLFNTLNNIYSLNLNAQNEKASEMISRLSDLLRYVLYKSKGDFISLNEEIKMIQNFIALESIRSDQLSLDLTLPESMDIHITLPPFLLLPLVENAFKHGVNSQFNQSLIQINLSITGREIILQVVNNFDPNYRNQSEGGLGLSNLKKRLEYYYPHQYNLQISETDNRYSAILKLPI